MRGSLHALLPACVLFAMALRTHAQTPQPSWSPVRDWSCQFSCPPLGYPEEFSHAYLLPTGPHRGKVLMWRLDCNSPNVTTEFWFFNPHQPGALIRLDQTLASEIFCSGASADADGNLVVAGGTGSPFPSQTYRFRPTTLGTITSSPNPCAQTPTMSAPQRPWIVLGNMAVQRYYPTLITLLRRAITIPSISSGGATLVLGGPWLRPPGVPPPLPPSNNYGNEWWELLGKGLSSWASPIYPVTAPGHPPGAPSPPLANFVPYSLNTGPSAPGAPQVLLDSYPRTFQLADIPPFLGNILITSDTETYAFNVPTEPGCTWVMRPPTGGNGWELWSTTLAGATSGTTNERFYGTAIFGHWLGSNGRNRAIAFGGSQDLNHVPGQRTSGNWTPNSSVQEFFSGSDPAGLSATWQSLPAMNSQRVYVNGVILPTGKVFLVGGASAYTHPGGGGTSVPTAPVLTPELYDPGTNHTNAVGPNTVPLPASTVPRLYHSMALLLPDATVFVVGGHDLGGLYPSSGYSGEVFSPDYANVPAGGRPAILSAPTLAGFSPATFGLFYDLPQGSTIHRVVLLRPATVTHHFDSDQRYIELDYAPPPNSEAECLIVSSPAEDLGPPGWYMMFLVVQDSSGMLVPSTAHWIQFL